jgi:Ulp1 family protease
VYDINKLEVVKVMYQVHHNALPASVTKLFCRKDVIHSYKTRQHQSFFHQFAASTNRQMTIFIRGPILWDSVPVLIKNVHSFDSFKGKFKKILVTSQLH